MNARRAVSVATTLLALGCAAPAVAQVVTTSTEGLTLRQTFSSMTDEFGGSVFGEAIGLGLVLEVATTPTGTSSGGFVFNLDPATGNQERVATFGPAFAERALTSGEGKLGVNVNFIASSFDKLGTLPLGNLNMATVRIGRDSFSGKADFALTSKTLVLSGGIGVTDNLDIGVAVPLVSVKLDGVTWFQDDIRKDAQGKPIVHVLNKGGGTSSGLGDIAALAKYRLLRFGTGLRDPGGLAVVGILRVPSGDRENLRGLGITRALGSLVMSSGTGRIRPHANVGYERWSGGLDVRTLDVGGQDATVTVRDQFQFAAGTEFDAAQKLTILVDLLGRRILGGGQVNYRTATLNPTTVVEFPAVLPESVQKLTLVPGLKLNLKGKLLLSLNAMIALKDNGLHSRFTPVVGLELTL